MSPKDEIILILWRTVSKQPCFMPSTTLGRSTMIYHSHRVAPLWWSASFSRGLVSSEGNFTELEAFLNIFYLVFHICVFSKALVLRKAPFGLANEVKASIWQLVSDLFITFSWMVQWKDPFRRFWIMTFTESVHLTSRPEEDLGWACASAIPLLYCREHYHLVLLTSFA